jgi:hypothetical protein
MSDAIPITIAALSYGTITTSGTYDVSVGALATVDIEGTSSAPINVTVDQGGLISGAIVSTTNISNADEFVNALGNVDVLTTYNVGEDGAGGVTGHGTLAFGSGLANVTLLSSINLDGTNDKIVLGSGLNIDLLNNLNGFAPSDTINLQNVLATSATFTQNSGLFGPQPGGTVTLLDNGVVTGQFSLSTGTFAPDGFQVVSDPGGGVDLTVCFLEGTRLLGLHGDIAVEDMEPGDCLITDGGSMRPVRWVGKRHIDADRHPRPETVWPIRIAAGAIAHGLPERTLYLSPDHALYLDGRLVPAKALVNGRSIVQEPRRQINYYHIELDSHDIVLAESLPCESYLETGNRNFFENGGGAIVLHPDLAQTMREAEGCAPFAEQGPIVTAIRERIAGRLPALTRTTDCCLRVFIGDSELAITTVNAQTYRIALPEEAADLVLASRAMVPAETDTSSEDRRMLGLDIGTLSIETETGTRLIAIEDSRLRDGWHLFEGQHRWTNGKARIPAELLAAGRDLIVRLHAITSYPIEPVSGVPVLTAVLHYQTAS